MLRKGQEMEREVRQRMREGKGEVEIVHIFKKEELGGKTRLFARLLLGSGCSIGYHAHADEEEIFYVLRGQGKVTEDDKTYSVEAGDAILTGGGGGHSVENTSSDTLELLAVILLYA